MKVQGNYQSAFCHESESIYSELKCGWNSEARDKCFVMYCIIFGIHCPYRLINSRIVTVIDW